MSRLIAMWKYYIIFVSPNRRSDLSFFKGLRYACYKCYHISRSLLSNLRNEGPHCWNRIITNYSSLDLSVTHCMNKWSMYFKWFAQLGESPLISILTFLNLFLIGILFRINFQAKSYTFMNTM